MEKALVSIIVPVFNTEKYLKECLDSLLNQTYRNLEILLVDDGSVDNSWAICEKYASFDDRVRAFRKENGGQASARNFGIRMACGSYFAFVDSDDVVSLDFIERLYNACIEHCAEMAFSRISVFSGTLTKFEPNSVSVCHTEKDNIFKLYSSPKIADSIPIISFCNKLFKRELLCNFQFPEGMAYEDTASIFIPLYKMNTCVYVDSDLYYYRKNVNSTTSHSFNEKCMDAVKAFEMAQNFFSDKKDEYVVQRLYVPLMMHKIFCWWGFAYVLKDKVKSREILMSYRESCGRISGTVIPFRWKLLLKVIGNFPILYRIYRIFGIVRIGER